MFKTDNYDSVIAICAHEFTHLLLMHILENAYQVQRQVVANHAFAAAAGAIMTASDFYDASNGAPVNYNATASQKESL